MEKSLQIRVRVFHADAKTKPAFERIVYRDPSEPFRSDVVIDALQILFGKSSTIQFECHDIS